MKVFTHAMCSYPPLLWIGWLALSNCFCDSVKGANVIFSPLVFEISRCFEADPSASEYRPLGLNLLPNVRCSLLNVITMGAQSVYGRSVPIEKTLVQLEARVAPLSNLCKEVIRSIEKRPFFPKSALAQEAEPPAKPNGSERDHRLESKRKCRAFWFIHIWQMGWVAVGGLFFYIFGPRLAGLLANDLDQTRRAGCMRERKGFPRRPSANPALI